MEEKREGKRRSARKKREKNLTIPAYLYPL